MSAGGAAHVCSCDNQPGSSQDRRRSSAGGAGGWRCWRQRPRAGTETEAPGIQMRLGRRSGGDASPGATRRRSRVGTNTSWDGSAKGQLQRSRSRMRLLLLACASVTDVDGCRKPVMLELVVLRLMVILVLSGTDDMFPSEIKDTKELG